MQPQLQMLRIEPDSDELSGKGHEEIQSPISNILALTSSFKTCSSTPYYLLAPSRSWPASKHILANPLWISTSSIRQACQIESRLIALFHTSTPSMRPEYLLSIVSITLSLAVLVGTAVYSICPGPSSDLTPSLRV